MPQMEHAIARRMTRVVKLGGGTISVVLSADDTDGRVEAFDFFVPPSHPGVTAHVHERADEFFTILDGVAEFVIGGDRIVVPAGQNIVAPRGMSHGWRNAGTSPLRLIVSFSPAIGMENYFAELAAIVKNSWPPPANVMAELWSRCDTRPA